MYLAHKPRKPHCTGCHVDSLSRGHAGQRGQSRGRVVIHVDRPRGQACGLTFGNIAESSRERMRRQVRTRADTWSHVA